MKSYSRRGKLFWEFVMMCCDIAGLVCWIGWQVMGEMYQGFQLAHKRAEKRKLSHEKFL